MGNSFMKGAADAHYKRMMTPLGLAGANVNIAEQRLVVIESMYRRLITELAINRYKWEGLPDSVSERFIERTLFINGLAVFYLDPRYGKHLCLQASPLGAPNMEDEYFMYQTYGQGGFTPIRVALQDIYDAHGNLSTPKGVPIWPNMLRIPDHDVLQVFAPRLADYDLSLEINGRQTRRTRVLVVETDSQRLTMQNVNAAIDRGDAAVTVRNRDVINNVQGFDLGVTPKSLEELDVVQSRVWNKCMTALGIDNSNQDKKERLVAAEVDANNDQVMNIRSIGLRAREAACYAINKQFGLNVSVKYNQEVDDMAAAYQPGGMVDQLGEDDGEDEADDNS